MSQPSNFVPHLHTDTSDLSGHCFLLFLLPKLLVALLKYMRSLLGRQLVAHIKSPFVRFPMIFVWFRFWCFLYKLVQQLSLEMRTTMHPLNRLEFHIGVNTKLFVDATKPHNLNTHVACKLHTKYGPRGQIYCNKCIPQIHTSKPGKHLKVLEMHPLENAAN